MLFLIFNAYTKRRKLFAESVIVAVSKSGKLRPFKMQLAFAVNKLIIYVNGYDLG